MRQARDHRDSADLPESIAHLGVQRDCPAALAGYLGAGMGSAVGLGAGFDDGDVVGPTVDDGGAQPGVSRTSST